ncbi:MAG: hypothetical protein CME19_00180 [Gemmatimonadetes bacterium]|nr:hypothetical protein [Gemmatimonadota bacterium]
MIEAGYGQSTNREASEAFSEAVKTAVEPLEGDPEVVICFASGDHLRKIDEGLSAAVDAANTDRVVGCSGMGVLSIEGELERTSGVVALALGGEAIEAVPFRVDAEDAGTAIESLLGPYSAEAGLLCLLPTISGGDPAEMIEHLSEALPFPIVGGAASGAPMDPNTAQWLGTEWRSDGVSGVLLRGEFEILTGVAQGCQPFGQAYTITKADGHVVHELAFSPAIDALKEALDHLTPEQKENVGPQIFAGIAIDEHDMDRNRGDFLIRNLIGMNPDDGSIAIGERVEVGQTIQFNRRTADAAHLDLEQTTQAIKRQLGDRSSAFGLYFNCLGRGFGLYGQPDHDVNVIRNDLGAFPLVGFFGNAEFAPVGGKNFIHSYTGGLVVFTDLEA